MGALQVVRLTAGATGKAVKIGRGRAAVTGDNRRKGHCCDVESQWEGAAGERPGSQKTCL